MQTAVRACAPSSLCCAATCRSTSTPKSPCLAPMPMTLMAAAATSCSPRCVAPLLKLVASSSSSTARPRRPLVQQLQLPRLRATAAVAAAPLALAPPPSRSSPNRSSICALFLPLAISPSQTTPFRSVSSGPLLYFYFLILACRGANQSWLW
ncbi:hypothetical protein PVAP13_1KG522608 [Panicum virgatum]|uniref:Uncharacterized protein n=1 Tax=Panicum virgatum TaxID=38727 RepID=A0A8T0XZ94_PANVG|nr:hypothetical protein PVAP13_1KG522608 [Panicum virgatum]